MVIDELDELVLECWPSEFLFSILRPSGVNRDSGALSPFSFLNIEAAVDFFEPLPCVVVDVDRNELLGEDSGRG